MRKSDKNGKRFWRVGVDGRVCVCVCAGLENNRTLEWKGGENKIRTDATVIMPMSMPPPPSPYLGHWARVRILRDSDRGAPTTFALHYRVHRWGLFRIFARTMTTTLPMKNLPVRLPSHGSAADDIIRRALRGREVLLLVVFPTLTKPAVRGVK